MKPKLTLSSKQINNFSIDVVKDFEGCPEALIFLKRIYKDEVTNLTNRKKDFVDLVENNKGPWIINFLLNCIKKPYRARFFLDIVSSEFNKFCSNKTLCVNKDINLSSVLTYTEKPLKKNLKKVNKFKKDIIAHREHIKEEINKIDFNNGSRTFNLLLSESKFLKSIIIFLDGIEGNLTRQTLMSLKLIAEAFTWLAFYNEQPNQVDINNQLIKQYSLYLIDYTQIFK